MKRKSFIQFSRNQLLKNSGYALCASNIVFRIAARDGCVCFAVSNLVSSVDDNINRLRDNLVRLQCGKRNPDIINSD